MKNQIEPNNIVTPYPIRKGNAVFRVQRRTGNGWLVCSLFSDLDGTPRSSEYLFRFRTSEMTKYGWGEAVDRANQNLVKEAA
jgi:hypothetical protein